MPVTQARIDPMDRGFMFGDALYEGVKVLRGVPLFLEAHLERLRQGLARIKIPFPSSLQADCFKLLGASELDNGFLYLQITRGVAPRVHLPPLGLQPTVFLLPTEVEFTAPASRPRRLSTVLDPRWTHCDLKTTSLMATVISRIPGGSTAITAPTETDEILFVGEEEQIREGGHTNFFARHGERLQTHPLDGRILPGVTRRLVLELAAEAGIEVTERAPILSQRTEWSEAFVCGSMTGIEGVIEVDGNTISGGRVGAWTKSLALQLAALEDSVGGQ